MKLSPKKAVRIILKIFLWFLLLIAIYLISAYVLSKIQVNSVDLDKQQDVTIYIKSNGVHTDIVLPAKNDIKDWTTEIQYSHTISKDSTLNYIAFGWGNKDFYLNTPEWTDLKVTTALKAAFHMGNTAMHTQFYSDLPESENCKKIIISNAEYQKIVSHVYNTFSKDENGNFQLIQDHNYNQNDAFYEANGKYDLFNTCNSWTNSALKISGQKAAFWALTDMAILQHYND